MTRGGDGYTSAPTVTFSGGGGTTQAILKIQEWRSKWKVDIDNSANTTPYNVLPKNIYMLAGHGGGGVSTENTVEDQFHLYNLLDVLTVSGGQIAWVNPSGNYVTSSYLLHPTIVIEDLVPMPALATVNVKNDGTIQNIIVSQNPVGYAAPVTAAIRPTINSAPGSGASIALIAGALNHHTQEFQFNLNGYALLNAGSGYLQDLNQQNKAVAPGAYDFNGNTNNFTIKTNEVRILNFNYGTGKRRQIVN